MKETINSNDRIQLNSDMNYCKYEYEKFKKEIAILKNSLNNDKGENEKLVKENKKIKNYMNFFKSE